MIQKPRGTIDYCGSNIEELNFVIEKLKKISNKFNLKEIKTPTFEHSELFKKNIGETTDIVTKEIYEFLDKSNRSIALRPEGTASVVRYYIENKKYGNQTYVDKYFYIMNMFRYERPQNGRLREFYQYGVEFFKADNFFDVLEVINLAKNILDSFNFNDYKLKINNIGNFEQRGLWVKDLEVYFNKHKDKLPKDLQDKIQTNTLRILDSKEADETLINNSPKLTKYLTKEQIDNFNNILKNLKEMNIEYEVDNNLVRGLDYYTDVVFEFVSNSEDIAKSTIIGGGSYSKLINNLGGPDYNSIGFAIGLERLIYCLKLNNFNFTTKQLDKVYIYLDENDKEYYKVFKLANILREKFNIQTHYILNEHKKQKVIKYCNNNKIDKIIWLSNEQLILETLSDNKKIEYSLEEIKNKGV